VNDVSAQSLLLGRIAWRWRGPIPSDRTGIDNGVIVAVFEYSLMMLMSDGHLENWQTTQVTVE